MDQAGVPNVDSGRARLRIIHYCPGMTLEWGGVVRAVLDWCAILASRGHDVLLVTYYSPDVPTDWDGSAGKPTVVFLPLPPRSNGFLSRLALRAREALLPAQTVSRTNWFVSRQAKRIWEGLLTAQAVVHLHFSWTSSDIQMARAARRHGVPYVVTIHGMLDDWSMSRGKLKKRLFLAGGLRRYLQAASRLHYTAAAEGEQAKNWVPGSKSAVLPPVVDLAPYRQLPGPELARTQFSLKGDAPVLLYLSRLHEKKGVHLLIDAAAMLHQSGRRFSLIIAGVAIAVDRDYASGLRDQASRLGLDEIVSFVGQVTGTAKVSLYQAADLFVLPTAQENFGLVLIEAMAAGAPVLSTRGTDIWQEIEAAGATISDRNPRALHDAIVRLLDDRAALAESGRRGRDWVLRRFETDHLAADYENLYSQLLRERDAAK